jgi:hypothetical protein
MILLVLLGQLLLNPKSDETGDHDPTENCKANPEERSPKLDLGIAFHERQFCRTHQQGINRDNKDYWPGFLNPRPAKHQVIFIGVDDVDVSASDRSMNLKCMKENEGKCC